jgi:hypothetical protein
MNHQPVAKPNSVISLGNVEIGNAKKLTIIAGPCQLESRSHAFFYRAYGDNGDTGLMGLPILRNAQAQGGWTQTADMLFLRRQQRALSDFGRLTAEAAANANDSCQASCVDWYGNARPIFIRGRIFALLGYEIVEGHLTAKGIREKNRISFAPGRDYD